MEEYIFTYFLKNFNSIDECKFEVSSNSFKEAIDLLRIHLNKNENFQKTYNEGNFGVICNFKLTNNIK